MVAVKLVIALPGLVRPEVYRWFLEKPWYEIQTEDCQQKLKELTDGKFDHFVLHWFDGHDLCVIQNQNDIRLAFKFHRDREECRSCMRIYAAPTVPYSKAIMQAVSQLERTPSSQQLYEYAEKVKKRRLRLLESQYQAKPKFQKHYLWN